MCGLSGRINGGFKNSFPHDIFQCHRGSDDYGQKEERFRGEAYIGLGSRRLAIIDQCGWWRTGQMLLRRASALLLDVNA
jgi:hypothetical protein